MRGAGEAVSAAIRGGCAVVGLGEAARGPSAVLPNVTWLLLPRRPKRRIPLVPENLLKKRKAYQAIKATQAKQALLQKRKVGAGRGEALGAWRSGHCPSVRGAWPAARAWP